MDFLFLVLGLVFLFFGGEGILKGSVSIARQFGLSDFLVGAVVVGFGTSLPELSVSLEAAMNDSSGLVLGNVVGSNIANILLIVGVCTLVCPLKINGQTPLRDTLIVICASLALCFVSMLGVVDFWIGVAFFITLIIYLTWSYFSDQKLGQDIESEHDDDPILNIGVALGYCLVGLVLLVSGAILLVDGATSIARSLGVGDDIIGLTLVAAGTSLPELATGVVAAMRKRTDVLIGNVLGSSLFNILAILGLTSMIIPVPVSEHIANYDVWVMLGSTMLFMAFLWTDHKITRAEGAVMLTAYSVYIAWLGGFIPFLV